MGKIVKYCAACDESFAEKFAFCPNCGKTMQAFEMNPLAAAEITAEKANVGAANGNGTYKTETTAPLAPETFARIEPVKVFESPVVAPVEKTPVAAVVNETFSSETKTVEPSKPVAPVKETKTFAAAANGNGHQSQTSNDGYRTVASQTYKETGGFNVTVIEEKNSKQRNLLLLGALLMMLTVGAGGMVYSLFNYNLSIAAIGDESGLAMPVEDAVPMAVEDEAPKPKDDKDAGGGGGGGRDEPTPTSLGKLANQTEKPIIAPDKSIVQKDNFELKQPIASTQGNKTFPPSPLPYGDPNARAGLSSSNGMGTGGGQGSGIGTGQGSGRGTGAGSGIGSGFGAGNGNGNGNGNGDGNQGIGRPPAPPEPKKAVAAVTEPIKFISKPQGRYTDEARQNSITGTVLLNIQFLASGQVGSVSAVSGLPYGLTEKAIEAARQIKFEPAKKNGIPYTVSKRVQYGFTIY